MDLVSVDQHGLYSNDSYNYWDTILLIKRHAASIIYIIILTLLHIVIINTCMTRLTTPQGAYVCAPNPVGRYPTCFGRFKPRGNHVETSGSLSVAHSTITSTWSWVVLWSSLEKAVCKSPCCTCWIMSLRPVISTRVFLPPG